MDEDEVSLTWIIWKQGVEIEELNGRLQEMRRLLEDAQEAERQVNLEKEKPDE